MPSFLRYNYIHFRDERIFIFVRRINSDFLMSWGLVNLRHSIILINWHIGLTINFLTINRFYRLSGGSIIEKIQFWYAFMFLLFRLLSVLLCAASVNESAQMPKILIRSAPSNKWTSDVRLHQVSTNLSIESKFFWSCKGWVTRLSLIRLEYRANGSSTSQKPLSWL